MDVFSAPSIGSPRALASRSGNTAGTSTDIIYPVSRIVNGAFQSGKTLEFNYRSDKHRHVLLRSSRLVVHMEHKFGEVDTTCTDPLQGPKDSGGVRPSKSVMFATLPGTTLFGTGQARYVLNSVVVTNQNHLLDSSLVQLLLTTNNDGPSTSGSNMMTSTRKDTGLGAPSFFLGSENGSIKENYTLLPIEVAPYLDKDDGSNQRMTLDNEQLERLKDPDARSHAANVSFTAEIATGGDTGDSVFYVAKEEGDKLATSFGTGASGITGVSIEISQAGDAGAVLSPTSTVDGIELMTTGTYNGLYKISLGSGSSFTTGATTREAADAEGYDGEGVVTTVSLSKKVSDTDLGTVQFSRVAQAFAVKMKASAAKSTSPNPRAEILQQGFTLDNTGGGTVITQTSEPLMLDTWNTPYAIGPADHALFLTISPDWQKNLFTCIDGQYGCPVGRGGLINCDGTGADHFPPSIKPRQIYSRVTSVALHVHYVHPSEPYIPKSLSLRVSPVTVVTRQMHNEAVNESIVCSPAIKSCMIFIRQNDGGHVCQDRSELSLGGAGINALGSTDNDGIYRYDSRAIMDARDPTVDPRKPSGIAEAAGAGGLESTAPYGFTQLQVQCGGAIQPREALSQMSPHTGEMSRAWQLYTEFIGRAAGFRAAPLSYSEYTGYHNSNFASAPRAGDRGCFFLFDLQQKPGSLASTLEIRGLLEARPEVAAKQELVVVMVSDSILNIGYQAPSETPVLTEIQPVIGA